MLLPIASALKSTDDTDWSRQILLQSNPDSWNETSDLKGHVRYDDAEGEVAGPLALAIAAERIQNSGRQRAVVIGDSDFLDNEYIGFGDNASFALHLFDWLADPVRATHDVKDATDEMTLTMSETTLLITAVVLLLGLPLIFIFIALWQWRKAGRSDA
jgi:hypothetical protein